MAFNKNLPKGAIKAFNQNEMNLMGLMTSALDLSHKLYDFLQWINSPNILSTKPQEKKDF